MSKSNVLFFKFRPFQTTSTWEFVDPDTKFAYKAATEQELLQKIITYRDQNELPVIEELATVIENYLCMRPQNLGKCTPRKDLKRGLFMFLKGGIALLKNYWYDKIVSQDTADSRSEICKTCPHNVFPDKDNFVKWADSIAEASVGDKKSSNHSDLGNCEICTCPLRAKVWYGGPFNLPKAENEKLPSFCWQKDK